MTNQTLDALGVIEILDNAAESLVAPEWEWSIIGDNNMLAWETAAKVARLTGLREGECYPVVCESLRRRWRERFPEEGTS